MQAYKRIACVAPLDKGRHAYREDIGESLIGPKRLSESYTVAFADYRVIKTPPLSITPTKEP